MLRLTLLGTARSSIRAISTTMVSYNFLCLLALVPSNCSLGTQSRLEQCVVDLHLTDPRDDKKRIEDTKGGLLEDAYSWILSNKEFLDWRYDVGHNLLWVKGDPGKGKTMLLCGIIDQLTRHALNPCQKPVYFFCQATDSRLNSAVGVLRGLLFLLAVQHPEVIPYIRSKYEEGGKSAYEDANAWWVLSGIFAEMVNDSRLEEKIIVIDALDECTTDQERLLEFISRLSTSSRGKWVVSSRNWPSIERSLYSVPNTSRLSLELNASSVSASVHYYIEQNIEGLAKVRLYDEWALEEIRRHLHAESNDTFLWVALVFRELHKPGVLSHRVPNLLRRFPSGLDALYTRMIDEIFFLTDPDPFTDILSTISLAFRPISLEELASLVPILGTTENNADFLAKAIEHCGSFLTVRDRTIYFIHQSAQDFLLFQGSSRLFPSRIDGGHRRIFLRSLECLRNTLRYDMYNLGSPGVTVDKIAPPDPDPLSPILYPCSHWFDHLQFLLNIQSDDLDTLSEDVKELHAFLKTNFLFWLEALILADHLEDADRAVMIFRKLENKVVSAIVYPYTKCFTFAYIHSGISYTFDRLPLTRSPGTQQCCYRVKTSTIAIFAEQCQCKRSNFEHPL